LILVMALVMLSGVAFAAADWVDHLIIVPAVGVLGVLAGAALAWSRFGPRLAAVLGSIYGAFVVVWQLGQALDPELAPAPG
jgi:cytochrome bd-type quinol oxidase subunit 2